MILLETFLLIFWVKRSSPLEKKNSRFVQILIKLCRKPTEILPNSQTHTRIFFKHGVWNTKISPKPISLNFLFRFTRTFCSSKNIHQQLNRMKPLETYQRVLRLLCACPPDEQTQLWQRMLLFASGSSVFLSILCTATSSLAFVLNFIFIDLEESLWALFQFCGLTNMLYVMIISFSFRYKIKGIFDTLSTIYDASELATEIVASINNSLQFASEKIDCHSIFRSKWRFIQISGPNK